MGSYYVKFVSVPTHGKTERWEVVTRDTEVPLGRIMWWPPWRKYVFCPSFPTSWDEDCLREIAGFIEARTRDYKQK